MAIQEKAEKLKNIIKETFTSYANLSQSLDRSFPLRVFDAQWTAKLAEDQLRKELMRLDDRRESLMNAGIIDSEVKAVTLRSGRIDSVVVKALEIYVGDAIDKLNVFDSLLARVDLFK